MHALRSVAAGLVLAALSVSLQAETIVEYDIGTLVDTSDVDVAGVAPNTGITAGDLTVVGLTRNTGSNQDGHFVFKGWRGSKKGAVTEGYFTFSFTVTKGTEVDLTNLTYQARASSAGPRTIGLYWSVDNYAAPLGQFAVGGNSILTVDFDLSGTPTLVGVGKRLNFDS